MYQQNSSPWNRRALLPLLLVAGLVATLLGAWLYSSVKTPAYGAWAGWWSPFGWFFSVPILFVGFFVLRWLFWGGWCWWGPGSWYYGGADPALETLRQRFVSGEISKEQYEQMRRDLERPQ